VEKRSLEVNGGKNVSCKESLGTAGFPILLLSPN
jgi:hypothetical protein